MERGPDAEAPDAARDVPPAEGALSPGARARKLNDPEGRSVRQRVTQEWQGDVIDGNPVASFPLRRSVMRVTMEDRRDTVAIERFLQAAGTQEGIDLFRFAFHG